MIDEKRVNTVLAIWQDIHNNAIKKGRLEYVVVPSADVRGKSFEDLKKLSFSVGPSESKTIGLSIEELTALFAFIKDQAAQLRKITAGRATSQPANVQVSTKVNFAPSDDEIKSMLAEIEFTIPGNRDDARRPWKNRITVGDFGLTEDRVQFVLSLMKKKINAELCGKTGSHFRVYPPPTFLDTENVLNGPEIYDRLGETTWYLKWSDEQIDPLRFIELLVFIDQVIGTEAALKQVIATARASGTQPAKINVSGGGFAPAELAKDESIRALLARIEIEEEALPQNWNN